jgi:hypothetical protein
MVEDWIANAYEGMSRRQFLARMGAAGGGLGASRSPRIPWQAKSLRLPPKASKRLARQQSL